MLNDERRTIDEAYTSATASSNLRLEAERRGDADVLIASGLNPVRMGSALLRLHTEYDCVARAQQRTAGSFAGAVTTPAWKACHGPQSPLVNHRTEASAAKAMALKANAQEAALMLAQLRTLPEVRGALKAEMLKWDAEDAETVVAEVLRWWLRSTCPACGGTCYEAVAGTGRLSARVCKACRGNGKTPLPCGQIGRRLANYMDDCISSARQSIRKRLHPVAATA